MIAGPNGAVKTTTAMSFITREMIDDLKIEEPNIWKEIQEVAHAKQA